MEMECSHVVPGGTIGEVVGMSALRRHAARPTTTVKCTIYKGSSMYSQNSFLFGIPQYHTASPQGNLQDNTLIFKSIAAPRAIKV